MSGDNGNIDLNHAEILRYSRHLLIPEVGLSGQKKIKAASVLVIGTGGLGSPVSLYLAAAGVGRIGLVDYDVVDESNLQRQVIHGMDFIDDDPLDRGEHLSCLGGEHQVQRFWSRDQDVRRITEHSPAFVRRGIAGP